MNQTQITLEPRSVSKKRKLEKERLEFQKRIQRLDRKWNTIWATSIFIYLILGTIFAFTGFTHASMAMLFGMVLSVAFWNHHRLDIQDQMDKIEEMERLEDRIIEEIKQQEILEKEISELKSD